MTGGIYRSIIGLGLVIQLTQGINEMERPTQENIEKLAEFQALCMTRAELLAMAKEHYTQQYSTFPTIFECDTAIMESKLQRGDIVANQVFQIIMEKYHKKQDNTKNLTDSELLNELNR